MKSDHEDLAPLNMQCVEVRRQVVSEALDAVSPIMFPSLSAEQLTAFQQKLDLFYEQEHKKLWGRGHSGEV